MNYIEYKYLNQISYKLEGFHKQRENLFNFRCPFCNDSKKDKSKKRGYIYDKENKTRYICHNCGVSLPFYKFLNHIDDNVYRQFKLENFKAVSGYIEKTDAEESFTTKDIKKHFENNYLKKCILLDKIDVDDLLYPVKEYCIKRKLPEEFFNKIYACNDINDITNLIPKFKDKKYPKFQCMVLPFFKKDNTYNFLQCRTIEKNTNPSYRFNTFELKENSIKLWGEFRINWSKQVFVLEGAIDAMFVDNAVALAGSSVYDSFEYIKMKQLQELGKNDLSKIVVCYDNDYKDNKEILKQLKKRLQEGYSVVIYDKQFKSKDINNIILDYDWTQEEVNEYLKKRVFFGLKATLELSKYK